MHTGKGHIIETILEDGQHLVRIACSPNLIPTPGQYLLAGSAADSPLPVSLFYTESVPEGFLAPLPPLTVWNPGQEVALRGPLGRGFDAPTSARKVVLVAVDDTPVRLRGLIRPFLKLGAAVVLVSEFVADGLPNDVEVQPISALVDILQWADYVALDVRRETLSQLREKFEMLKQASAVREAQVLVRTLMPCGGIAECGVCAVALKSGWRMACKDGPVFQWGELA